MGKVLRRGNLSFDKTVALLWKPGWREHPGAPDLLTKLTQKPLFSILGPEFALYPFYLGWRSGEIESLLADPFWHNHRALKERVGRGRLRGQKPVTLHNMVYSSCTGLTDRLVQRFTLGSF